MTCLEVGVCSEDSGQEPLRRSFGVPVDHFDGIGKRSGQTRMVGGDGSRRRVDVLISSRAGPFP